MEIDFKTNADELFTDVFYRLKNASKRFVICYGGSSASKSYSMQQLFIIYLLTENTDLLIIRKYGTDLYNSVYDSLKFIINQWDITHLFEFVYGNAMREIRNTITGTKIILKGLDDTEKIKSIKHGIKRIYIEEANQLTIKDFLELNRRLRGIDNIQLYLLFNPILATHWIKKHFFDTVSVAEHCEYIHCTYKDNKFNTADDVKQLEELKTVNINDYNVYCLGQWGTQSEGLVFKPNEWKIVGEIPAEAKKLPYGLDFGFVNDPTAIIEVFICNGQIYANELVYKTGLINTDPEADTIVVDSIENELTRHNFNKNELIVADSSEIKSIRELRIKGYNIRPVSKAQKEHNSNILFGLKCLKRYYINITSNSKNLIHEFENYCWSENKDGDKQNKPIDKYNHAIDALRYVVQSKGVLW